MSAVPSVAAAFFPLDKELQVPDGHLLPHAQETLVSLSSELPFGRVVKHLKRTLGVVVPVSTVRRQTLGVGERMLEVQNAQARPLADCPEEPAPERMAMSSDGSMVPLVGGVWAEVKVVALGQVDRRQHEEQEEIVTSELTYFARMSDAATFADQASAELRRRGIERAKEVCAIQDGDGKRNNQMVSINCVQEARTCRFIDLFQAWYRLEDEGQVDVIRRALLNYITYLCTCPYVDNPHPCM